MMSNIEFLLVSPLYKKNLKSYVYPLVEGWIKSFSDADLIVTDSFHGTVFSIIFNKPFISIINKERGAARSYSLLSKLNLIDRIISDYESLKLNSMSDIDYQNVNIMLEKYRLNSYNFLLSSLGE